MAANKIVSAPATFIANAAANILNCAITSLTGPVGYTQTQPYLILKHIRINNVTGSAVTVSLYKGATGASAAGTQFAFGAYSLPANSFQDWYGQARFDATDFLTGVASTASAVTFEADFEIGIA